jgi:hypothetical protein
MEHTPSARTSPRDFFLYLFAAGSLYFCAVTLVTLLWQLVNHWIPAPEAFGYSYYGDSIAAALRWSIALLIVIFPAYVIAMWRIGKDVDRAPEKRELWVRRWFVYATLFIASATLLGDLVYLVYALLGGDVALRFALKAVSVALVAGAVLAYHLFLLRREPGTGMGTRKAITVVASAAVLAAVIAGFCIAGSPVDARRQANDARRVSDLQGLQWQMTTFWQQKQRLPENLGELVDPANPVPLPTDPVTAGTYRYEKLGETGFRLCATFEAKDDGMPEGGQSVAYPGPEYDASGMPQTWAHGAGETCFERAIDPERYPSLKGI